MDDGCRCGIMMSVEKAINHFQFQIELLNEMGDLIFQT